MRTKIFLDSADIKEIKKYSEIQEIKGFTTNPSLMRKEGVTNYTDFIKKVTDISDKPFSFEVFADEEQEMFDQAIKISELAPNIYVKIPIMNTQGFGVQDLVKNLNEEGVKLNITAVMTGKQVRTLAPFLKPTVKNIISIFAGRIADTGVDPSEEVLAAKYVILGKKNVELLWASCRQVFDFYLASKYNCDIITMPPDLLKKLSLRNKNLEKFSRETVQQFFDDARASKFKL